jgi:hypothetical protein
MLTLSIAGSSAVLVEGAAIATITRLLLSAVPIAIAVNVHGDEPEPSVALAW